MGRVKTVLAIPYRSADRSSLLGYDDPLTDRLPDSGDRHTDRYGRSSPQFLTIGRLGKPVLERATGLVIAEWISKGTDRHTDRQSRVPI